MANAKSALEKVNKEFGIKSSSTSQKNDKRKQSTSVSSSETKSTNKNAKTALEKVNKEFGVGKYSNHTSVGNTTSRHIDEINRHLANAGLDHKETPPATSIDQIFEDNVGYVAEKFGRGIVDGLESMTDFGWNVVGGLGWGLTSAFGLNENKLSDAIADWTADIQTDDIVDYFEAPEDKYQYASNEVKKYGWLPETIGNIGASMGTGALIKGLGLAGQYGDDAVKLGTTAYDKVSKFLTNPQTLFGASAAGSAAEEATEKGANPIQSTIYGGLTGAMEVGTEKIFPGVADSVVGKTFVNFTSKSPVVNKALSILGEGAEEMIMTGIEPSLKRITGVDTNAQHATWADYVESGKHGMILSAVMGVANMPIQNYNRSKAVKELNVATEAINELTVADAPKLQPLPINASEKAIEARQAEIKAFAKAYNTFVAQNVEAETTPDTLERDVVEKSRTSVTPLERVEAMSINGETISAEDARQATAYGENGAKLLADTVNNTPDKSFSEIKSDMHVPYMAGFSNQEISLDTDIKREAYYAGAKDRVMAYPDADARAKNAVVYDEESGVDFNDEHTNPYNRQELKMADTMGKDFGEKISFEERVMANYNAEANAKHQDGEITISNNSDNKLFEDTVHEGFHRMKEMNTPEVQTLERELFAFADSEGILFENERAKYEQAGMSLDTGGYIEEVVADIVPKLWRNEKSWNRWRERLDSNPELRSGWQKLMDFITELMEKVRRLLKEGSFSKEARAKVNKDLAELERFRNLYGDAYKATRDAVQERAKEVKAKSETKAETKADTKTATEATSKPVASESKVTNKETPSKAESKPQGKIRRPKVGEVYKANATGKTYTITERNDTHTTYTVTDNKGKTTTRTVKNSAADANFNRSGKEGFTRVQSEGIKKGDVFTADKETYKIVARDDRNTTVEISSEEGTKTMVISNEIADRNFSNMSRDGITKWIDEDSHIDNRTWEEVGDRKVKAFQYLFPEMQDYYKPLAQELISDLDNTIQGERMKIGSYEMNNEEWIGVERFTSEAIAAIKDNNNVTYDDIRNALNRLIEDKGQENIALAKRIEIVFDDMLTKGYTTFEGMEIPPNEEYITKKEALIGKTYEKYEPSELDEDLPFFSLKDKKTDTKSTKNLEIKINEEYNGNDLKTKIKYSPRGIKLQKNEYAKFHQSTSTDYYKSYKTHEGLQYQSCVTDDTHILYVYEDGGFDHYNVVARVDYKYDAVAKTIMEEIDNGKYYKVTDLVNEMLEIPEVRQSGYSLYNAYTKKRSGSRGDGTLSKGQSNTNAGRVNESSRGTARDERGTGTGRSVNEDKSYSLKDSEGKTLTKGQQEYFKDSKVRDENGNLLVCYHGTDAEFTIFDANFISDDNKLGNGFYFMAGKELQFSYDNIKKVYLNITNPITDTSKKLSERKVKNFCKKLGISIDYADGDSDLDVYERLSYEYTGDKKTFLKEVVNILGVDGVLSNERSVAVTFNSEQAKLTTNENPTSNPDIRFSLKKPVEQTKNLVAVHNVWEHKLRQAFELGGLPSPSIAITKKDFSHENFGDISLLFRKDTISPTDRRNKVYGGDAYTPTKREIDYKISDKALDKISGKIKGLVGKDIRSAFHLSLDSGNVEFDLKRADGNFVEAYKQNETLKIAYLNDKGIPFKPVMKTKELSRYADNIVLRRVSRAIGEDTLKKASSDSKVALAQEPMIRKLLNDRMEEQGAPRIYDKQLSGNELFSIIDGALSYISQGETKTVDYYATRDRLNNKFTKKLTAEYEKWLAELGEGIIEKKGIRNDRDLFTPSGSRRSFEALHWDYTLENIVKSMNGQQSKGSAMWGGNVFGASTKEYSSIAEIKSDSSRLQEMTDEEYEALKSEYKDRLNDIAEAYSNGKSVYDAEDTLIEAIATKKTKQGVKSYLAQYDYVYKVTDDIVNDLWELRNDISQMPVSYFEAKPQRAVGWNEVVAAVIPKKTDKSLKTELENRGIKVIEYDKGKDGERLKKINSVPDINFSLKGGVSTSELFDTLQDAKNGKKKAIDKLSKYAEEGLIRTEEYDALIKKYGIIPTGERPHRDVTVPAKTAKDKKVSMTVRTILEAEATPDTLVPTIEKMVEDGVFSYEVYSDKKAVNEADKYIERYGWEESLSDWFDAVNKGEVAKDITVMGWKLYNNSANIAATTESESERKKATENAVRILEAMSRHQRNAAQALQATRILKKMSPETQLYAVQKSVNAYQKELTSKYGKKAPDLKINEELAEQFLTAETEEARLDAEIKIYKDIGKQMPSTFMDKWNAWRYLAMLGNLRTHVRNVVGNAGFAPIVATKNLVATGIESLVNPSIRGINYIVSHVAPSVRWSGKEMLRSKKIVFGSKADRALLKAAWKDYANVADLVSSGGKYNDSAVASQHIEDGRKIFNNWQPKWKVLKPVAKVTNAVATPLEWARKGNSKALETEDVWFSKPHYAYALAMYCKANNITPEQIQRGKAIAPAREYAIKEAQKATYKDTNAFSQFVSSLGRTSTKKNAVTKTASAVIEGILPFRKTPANILVRGVEYSPLGLVKGLTRDLYKVSKGELNAYEAIDNISAGLTGTGLLALGVYFAAEGLIRGHGEDEEKEKAFKEMMGHQAYSLELPNGQSITLDWLAPEALPFFVGVNIWEQTKGKNEKVNMASILQAVTGITEPMLEMSCLQGVNDLIEGVGYASSNGMSGLMAVLSSATTSYLTQGIPTLFGQAERTGEEDRMTTYTNKNDFLTGDMQYLLGKASAKIPGWDYNQIPYIDAWGRKEASGTALKRGLNNFLNPAYTSTIESSEMEKELLRVYEQTGEASVFPTRADKYFMIDGVRKDLTADEFVRYATLKGERSYKLVTELVESEAYKKLSDKEKVKAIEEVYDYANQKAKEAISKYKPQNWVGKADDFENPENYIAFRSAVTGDMSKQDVVDIILDLAENDSEAWDMYLSEYDSKAAIEARNDGVDADVFMAYSAGVSKADEDGSLKKEEVVDVIAGMDIDNDDAWTLYLGKYDSKTAIEAEKHGIDAKLFMTATVDMGSIKADYDSNGKSISGSRRAKIERYLNSVCDSYKEYLFLLGTEYESVKKDHDYISYFGE